MAPLLDLSTAESGRSPALLARSGGVRSTRPASSTLASVDPRAVKMDRVPAADDTDTATRQTVEMMCDYIRKAAADPFVQQCANTAWRRFGRSSPDLNMKAWAAFWWVKHCIKFRLDEATMFQVGEKDQQDFLVSPSVLFRMDKPAEDCDGFTMAEAVLLVCLGVPVFIATVAASPDDRNRWSHVFPCSFINGKPLPLDASHGVGPGWMVPPKNIFRWQAWDMDAKPIDIRPSKFQGLHGYVRTGGAARMRPMMSRSMYARRRGVGDLCSDFGVGCDVLPPVTDSSDPGSWLQWGTPGVSPSPSSGSGFNWSSFLNNLVGNAASVAKVIGAPTTTVSYPGGPTITGPAGSVASPSLLGSSSSLLPIGLGLAALFLVVSAMGKK